MAYVLCRKILNESRTCVLSRPLPIIAPSLEKAASFCIWFKSTTTAMPSQEKATFALTLGGIEFCLTSHSGKITGNIFDSVSLSKHNGGEILIELNKFVGMLRIKDRRISLSGPASGETSCTDVADVDNKKRAATTLDNEPAAKRAKKNHMDNRVGIIGGSEIIQNPQPISRLVARLRKKPATLHDLWVEYQFGSKGVKAAKDFSDRERGAVKSAYWMRKIFWSKCADMIKCGMSADAAINRIYEAYAPVKRVSEILKKMKKAKTEGWPPLLQKTKLKEGCLYGGSYVAKLPSDYKSPLAVLCKNPKTLNDLWIEYRFGSSGRKAAKDFHKNERGAVKYMYHNRRPFWEKCNEMIQCGMPPCVAIDTIYRAYGRTTSITNILKQMRIDRKEGWPPLLQLKPPPKPASEVRPPASLSKRPKTLQELWKEYTVGLNGNKPAKDFDEKERGANKHLYSYRLKFWSKCSEMIRCGMTAEVAIDTIHQAYGPSLSITAILKQMRHDEKNGTWPPQLQLLNV